jgi:hypothetical protein
MSAPPGQPRILQPPLAWFPNTLEYTWQPPSNQGSSPIQGYRLTLNPGNLVYTVGNDTYYKVEGLTNALTYRTTIEASNLQGYGPPASFMDFQTGSPPPVSPSFVSAIVVNVSSVSIGWQSPTTLPDADIFWYYITGQSIFPTDPIVSTNGWALSQSNAVLSNINIFSDYVFNVQAVNCPGYSPILSTPLAKFRATLTGGNVSFGSNFTLRTFPTVGTTTFTIADLPLLADLLVVGGGGGAGGGAGGAGGAGGVIYRSSIILQVGSYTVTVGSGGNGSSSTTLQGQNGGNSVFGTFIALGGGGGGCTYGVASTRNGLAGGSGGAGGSIGDGTSGTGGAGQQPSSASGGFGNAGANASYQAPCFSGAGGGGAGQVGGGAPDGFEGGRGGNGIIVPITGSSVYYGGGGGGGVQFTNVEGTSGQGGLGGGGRGASGAYTAAGENGVANTGGGGGGGGRNDNVQQANGGSGIIILRYRT